LWTGMTTASARMLEPITPIPPVQPPTRQHRGRRPRVRSRPPRGARSCATPALVAVCGVRDRRLRGTPPPDAASGTRRRCRRR
jgi:hypothetical protein